MAPLEVFEDHTRTILSRNDSPDVGFDWSVNPYRGCFHACAYCYARPSHEYLSFGAGTDFERKIVVKKHAPELLREAFDAPKWRGELVIFSGVTDCYQPLEASYRLTRGCLEVCAEYRNPAGIITKAPLIERDIDVLQELARVAHLSVMVSVPFWDEAKARAIEPFVTTPVRRMRTIERLARAGVRVGVMVAPIIPGLNDEDHRRGAARRAGRRRDPRRERAPAPSRTGQGRVRGAPASLAAAPGRPGPPPYPRDARRQDERPAFRRSRQGSRDPTPMRSRRSSSRRRRGSGSRRIGHRTKGQARSVVQGVSSRSFEASGRERRPDPRQAIRSRATVAARS